MDYLKLAQEKLDYNPENGEFRRKKDCWRWRKGELVGCENSDGYRVIYLGNKLFLAHRIVFLLENGVFPEGQVDHIDRNPRNNRRNNLRLVTASQNTQNTRGHKDSITRLKGVFPVKGTKWFRGRYMKKGKIYELGFFETAIQAYNAVESHRNLELEN